MDLKKIATTGIGYGIIRKITKLFIQLSPSFEEKYQILKDTLTTLDKQEHIGKLYYPGSGFDKTPKETLGLERVIHLSKEETNYFSHLGNGMKVQADFIHSPFKDNSFDATLLWGPPVDAILYAIPEFQRVTKENGLFVVGTEELSGSGRRDGKYPGNFDMVHYYLDTFLPRKNIPNIDSRIIVYENKKARKPNTGKLEETLTKLTSWELTEAYECGMFASFFVSAYLAYQIGLPINNLAVFSGGIGLFQSLRDVPKCTGIYTKAEYAAYSGLGGIIGGIAGAYCGYLLR